MKPGAIELTHFEGDPACLYRMVDEEFKRIEASHVIPNPEQKMCIRTHKDTVSFKDMPVGAEWVCPSCGNKWFKILNMGKPAWANRP